MTSIIHMPHRAELAEEFRRVGLWNGDRLVDYLERWATETPERIAMGVPGEPGLSYREVLDRSRRFANALLGLGLVKGDVVAIQAPNVPEFLIAYYGVSMMGGVLCTLHMPYREGELAPLLRFAEAKAIICCPAIDRYDAPAAMQALRRIVPLLRHVIVAFGAAPEGCLGMDALIAGAGAERPAVEVLAADPCQLCFTSGTSAAPKGVVRTSETITANARIYSESIRLGREDRVLVAPPFTHVFGLCCVANAVFTGASIVLMPLFTPAAFAGAIADGRPTVMFCAPAHVAVTLKARLLDGVDFSALREVIIAGSVCPPETARTLEALLPNGRVGGLFGMTECGLVAQTPLDAGPEVRHHSVGRPTRGIEARLVTADGAVLPTGAEGELHLRGYSIMAGYHRNEDAMQSAFSADGWFRTGDIAIIDADNNICITGRVKDLINRGGIKINPTDIENAVNVHPKVMSSAVVAMPDEVFGEKACLFVVPVDGEDVSLREINAFLADNGIAKMRWPERLEVIAEMPMTPTRKIIKGVLTERAKTLV